MRTKKEERCIVHIGMHKTGTSSIQQTLNGFADDNFVYFPDHKGRPNHGRAIFGYLGTHGSDRPTGRTRITHGRREINPDGQEFLKTLKQTVPTLNKRPLVISSEGLIFLNETEVRTFADFLRGFFSHIEVVAYVRTPGAYIASIIQQKIKGGSLSEFDLEREYFNYEHNFHKFDVVFGRENVHLWKFDPSLFANRCVVTDFCSRLGLDIPNNKIVRVNESITKEALGLIYIYRKYGKEYGSCSLKGNDNRSLVQNLSDIGTSKLRFSPSLIKQLLDDNSDDIEWIENRIQMPLRDDYGEPKPDDIKSEVDLLTPSFETIQILLKRVGRILPKGVTNLSYSEIAGLVHCLRANNRPIHNASSSQSSMHTTERTTSSDTMNKVYFFVHIPKTAGTSFRKALEESKTVQLFYDYGSDSPESNHELLAIPAEDLSPDHSIFGGDKPSFICGHVGYGKYSSCVTPDSTASIIRNPIERIVSEYQHVRRHSSQKTTFAAFCSIPRHINKQARMLRRLKNLGSGLIGITSHYSYFLEVFTKRTGIEIPEFTFNTAPESDTAERFSIPVEDINLAYHLNKEDLDFFFEKVYHFIPELEKLGYTTTPPKRSNWNCRIDQKQRVIGWLSRGDNDCFFIILSVNGQKRAIAALDQPRPDISSRGLSKNQLCGFSFPLTLLGATAGDSIGVTVLGAPLMEKILVVGADASRENL